jgi:hypothetical protein
MDITLSQKLLIWTKIPQQLSPLQWPKVDSTSWIEVMYYECEYGQKKKREKATWMEHPTAAAEPVVAAAAAACPLGWDVAAPCGAAGA